MIPENPKGFLYGIQISKLPVWENVRIFLHGMETFFYMLK